MKKVRKFKKKFKNSSKRSNSFKVCKKKRKVKKIQQKKTCKIRKFQK